MQEEIKSLLLCYQKGAIEQVFSDYYCSTRDVFRARHDRWFNHLLKVMPIEKAAKLLTIVGEVGNNSFDHNLGHWQNAPGLCFYPQKDFVILFDCGRGIQASLKDAGFKFETDDDFFNAALTQRITGRAPERRGNGLKVSLAAVSELNIGFFIQSGDSYFANDKIPAEITDELKKYSNQGVIAYIYFGNLL